VTQPVALDDGDEIRLGSLTVTYRLAEPLPSTVTRVTNRALQARPKSNQSKSS
jgi:hypothetical protein